MKFQTNFLLVLLLFAGFTAFGQGVTTASINGKVVDDKGEPLIGSNITVIHVPSGTMYGNSTDMDGYYRIPAMKVGGPYSVTISYTGFTDFVKNDVYLRLGQSMKISPVLSEQAIELNAVVVKANRNDVFDGNRTGAETVITQEQINAMPTLSRAIGDFAKMTPQASITEGNDGYSISLGGQNNRYNAIYIDGAVNNDVFGLAGSGTNGGQTGVSPFAMDAIKEFQVALAPFDIREGGFGGGSINAITRSGSNQFEGSAYMFTRNQNMAGKTPTDNDKVERTKLDEFSASTYGFRLGGPIAKDKVFFFVNAEIQRDETPLPFNFADYQGDASQARIDDLASLLKSKYNYDPGTYLNNTSFLNSTKITANVDFNIAQGNKLTIRNSFVSAENLERAQSSPYSIRFQNGAEYFVSNTNTVSADWSLLINNSLANELKVGYTRVRDDRDPYKDPFPRVEIDDGSGSITFGSEPYSTANLLNQDVFTITDNLSIYKGKHNITLGTHNEFYKIKNLFLAFNYGWYYYDDSNRDNLQAFMDGDGSDKFKIVYSQVDDKFGDESAAAAEFSAGQFGFYAQDEYQVSDNFKVTGGVRFDIPFYSNSPENKGFNDTTLVKLEKHYDMKGAKTGDFIKPALMISPRIGFNWDVTGEQKTQLRGGVGVFTSRAPLVWVGGAFNNYGFNTGYYQDKSGKVLEPDVQKQLPDGVYDVNNPKPSNDIDLYASDFKLPQFLKANLVLDQKLGNGFVANFDILFNKTLKNVAYKNVNEMPSTKDLTNGGDHRPYYNRYNRIENTYQFIMLGYNTNKGYSYNFTTSLTKRFDFGLSGSMAYSYGDSYSVFDGSSSQNKSQWRYHYTINGRNIDDEVRRSQFSAGHRIMANASYKFDWNSGKNAGTTISFFYEGKTGQPYTYAYDDRGKLNHETSKSFQLLYVPKDENDINLVQNGDVTAAEQWRTLNEFIEADPYLSTRRGQYVERNASRAPWINALDVKISQDFSIKAGGQRHAFQVSLDFFNFGNLLSEKWGRRYLVRNNYTMLKFKGFEADGTTPKFTFDGRKYEDLKSNFIDDSGLQSSRWQMQLGLRYSFN